GDDAEWPIQGADVARAKPNGVYRSAERAGQSLGATRTRGLPEELRAATRVSLTKGSTRANGGRRKGQFWYITWQACCQARRTAVPKGVWTGEVCAVRRISPVER